MFASLFRSRASDIPFVSTLLLAVCLGSCARKNAAVPERLAVVPFENLSSSTNSDWLRRALGQAVASDLTSVPGVYARSVDSFNGAYAVQASRVLEGYFVESNGRLAIRATVLDLANRNAVQSLNVDGPVASGFIPLANQLAKEFNPAARPFSTRNEEAFHAYGEALGSSDRASALRLMQAAAKDDPRFALAYLDSANLLLSQGDRAGALAVIQTARREQLGAVDAAQLDYLAASARDDIGGREKALETLTHLTPADAKIFIDLAGLETEERKFPDAARNYAAVSQLEPDEGQVWNQLGYARAFAGDLQGARSALEHYQELVPRNNANPPDSLGEVSFYLGDFRGAEKYFLEADQKNREEFAGAGLLKAAEARLLAGDVAAADALFQKYVAFIRIRERGRESYFQAQWDFLVGRRKAAMAGLEKLTPSLQADLRSVALSQLSIWKLETGDAAAAEQLADQAGAVAVSPVARNVAALCRTISTPPGAGVSGPRLAGAYALLFARRYSEALPLLETIYRETDPRRDGQIRTLLAWAYVETNRVADAAPLVATYPIPLSSGEPLFADLIFPRFLFVRGVVLEQQGKRAEAKAAYQLFLKYSGDVPDIFADEARVRKSLTSL